MADKTRFAQLINERPTALDRSAGWLARVVGTSEANVSRWWATPVVQSDAAL